MDKTICLVFLGLVGLLGVAYAGVSECFECKQGWEDPETCNRTAEAVSCTGNDNSVCSIELKNENGAVGIRKKCLNKNACENNERKNEENCNGQNVTLYGNGKECVFCCDFDLCNYDSRNYMAGCSGLHVSLVMFFTLVVTVSFV